MSAAGSRIACSSAAARRAFTLIELLVVIVILGILMAVAVPTFLTQQQKAQDSKTRQQLATAYKAIRSQLPSFNNQYPVTASLVSAIAASEPELTVSSGSCNASVSDKQIVVDNVLTGPTKLSLYAKSGDGYWWNLSASATSAPTFTRLGTCQGVLATAAATVSGNEITDASRAAGVQGDGAAANSSYGLWEGTTNLVANGGFEVNTNYWVGFLANEQISQDTNDHVFGQSSLALTTTANIADGYFIGTAKATGVTNSFSGGSATATSESTNAYAVNPNATYTFSAWLRVPVPLSSSGSPQICLRPIEWDSSNNLVDDHGCMLKASSSTAAFGWTRFQTSFTTQASTAKVSLRINLNNVVGTVLVDGVQLEQKPTATPYVDTNGSPQSRAAALVEAPGNLVSGTQSWVAVRLRMGWPSTISGWNGGSGFETPFEWQIDSNNRITCFWTEGVDTWSTKRVEGTGIFTQANSPAQTFNAGDPQTVIFAWTATQVMVSVNGGAFASAGNTDIPVGSPPALMEVGSRTATANQAIDSNVMWFAAGTGTLSTSDAATINAWGDTDPTTQDFPATAQATMAWSADTARYVTGN